MYIFHTGGLFPGTTTYIQFSKNILQTLLLYRDFIQNTRAFEQFIPHLERMEVFLPTLLTNHIGRSHLQRLFTNQGNCGIIEYFSMLKIERAKQWILNQQLNFSQIADSLEYTSIHYFSRRFKKITGMTPSEYACSIKDLSERYS